MEKELQDHSWACLPKEMRDEIKSQYNQLSHNPQMDKYDSVYLSAIENIFGRNNLTSDTDSKEMLIVNRERVQEAYKHHLKFAKDANDQWHGGIIFILSELYGDKCLPDKPISKLINGAIGTSTPSHKLEVKEKCNSARITVPTVYGHLKHDPTKYQISVYSRIGWFKRLMLRWCFGLRYVKHNNTQKWK